MYSKAMIKWNLKELHPGQNNLEYTVYPDGSGATQNGEVAKITGKSGSTTVDPWIYEYKEREGEDCISARLSQGVDEFGNSKGTTRVVLPCLKLAQEAGTGYGEKYMNLDGSSRGCICGGTKAPAG